jgi:hypothetical protein
MASLGMYRKKFPLSEKQYNEKCNSKYTYNQLVNAYNNSVEYANKLRKIKLQLIHQYNIPRYSYLPISIPEAPIYNNNKCIVISAGVTPIIITAFYIPEDVISIDLDIEVYQLEFNISDVYNDLPLECILDESKNINPQQDIELLLHNHHNNKFPENDDIMIEDKITYRRVILIEPFIYLRPKETIRLTMYDKNDMRVHKKILYEKHRKSLLDDVPYLFLWSKTNKRLNIRHIYNNNSETVYRHAQLDCVQSNFI